MFANNDSVSLGNRIWPSLAVVAILLATAFQLHHQGRLWLCTCGARFWSGNICSSENSQQFLDPYSFTHVLHGLVYFILLRLLLPRVRPLWRLCLAITFAALWELFENTNLIIARYRAATAALGYTGDTVVNSLGDILCCALGFMIAEDALDRYLITRIESWTRNRVIRAGARIALNPSRTLSNAAQGRTPWSRAVRPLR